MSKQQQQPSDAQLREREPLYDACTVCGEPFEVPQPQPYCSPLCGRSQQL